MAKPKVLMISTQAKGVQNYGGMGPAVSQLAGHLIRDGGIETTILMPSSEQPPESNKWKKINLDMLLQGDALWETEVGNVPVFWFQTPLFPSPLEKEPIDNPTMAYNNDWTYPYTRGHLTPNQFQELMEFGNHVSSVLPSLESRFNPGIVHVHDWSMGFIPYSLKKDNSKPSVFTIHNAHYDGTLPLTSDIYSDVRSMFSVSDLTFEAFQARFTWNGSVSMNRIGSESAGLTTTVSKPYATYLNQNNPWREPLNISGGVENGVDISLGDFFGDVKDLGYILQMKQGQKGAILGNYEISFENMNKPLMAMVCRLVPEKGVEILLDILPEIHNATILIAGPVSDPHLYSRLQAASRQYKGAHIIEPQYQSQKQKFSIFAAADYFLGLNYNHPEPFGVAAREAMAALALPILDRRNGSGYDSLPVGVFSTGFFINLNEFRETAYRYKIKLKETIDLAVGEFNCQTMSDKRRRLYEEMQKNPFSWEPVVSFYAAGYQELLNKQMKKNKN